MPELPEVETVRRGLAPLVEGASFAAVELRRPDLRFAFPAGFAARLQGRRLESLKRRAKYLLGHLDNGLVLVMHLGMSGRLSIEHPGVARPAGGFIGGFVHPAGGNPSHDHVIFTLSNGAVIRYNDARRFGFMTLIEENALDSHKFFVGLGVEPLGGALTGAFLAGRAQAKTQPLKNFLTDQRVIAGLGNIYACEALFRARLPPHKETRFLTAKGAARLAAAIHAVLNAAIAAGGSSLKDYRRADGSPGLFQHDFAVYGRTGQPCRRPSCGGTIERLVQAGRSSFYCPRCQS